MPGESFAMPTDDRVGLNHLETSPPTGPASVQHNPQEPVAAVEAQATRRVLLENRKLVAKREYLRLKHGFENWRLSKRKGRRKSAHCGSHHDLTNSGNPCVFRSDGVFGNHRLHQEHHGDLRISMSPCLRTTSTATPDPSLRIRKSAKASPSRKFSTRTSSRFTGRQQFAK
jgi:hypothetical protein